MLIGVNDTMVVESFVKWALDAYALQPMVGIVLALMFLDVLFGLGAAFITKTISSTVSSSGMMRKVLILLMIAVAAVLEQIGTGGIPVTKLAAGFFAVTQLISITENAARAGIPIPPAILDTLQKLKSQEKASVLHQGKGDVVHINSAQLVSVNTEGGSTVQAKTEANDKAKMDKLDSIQADVNRVGDQLESISPGSSGIISKRTRPPSSVIIKGKDITIIPNNDKPKEST